MSETTGAARASRPRRPAPVPGRRQLVGGALMVMVGSFMPWVDTGVGAIMGGQGPGLWTFYAALIGLAGALVPLRTLAVVQGAVLAVVAVALPVWQVANVWTAIGWGGWSPGPGVVLVLGGGVLAAVGARRRWSPPSAAERPD